MAWNGPRYRSPRQRDIATQVAREQARARTIAAPPQHCIGCGDMTLAVDLCLGLCPACSKRAAADHRAKLPQCGKCRRGVPGHEGPETPDLRCWACKREESQR